MSPNGSKIDFKGDPIFESAVWFFVIILEFIFTSIFEIKIHEKNPDSLGVNIIDSAYPNDAQCSRALLSETICTFNVPNPGVKKSLISQMSAFP